RTAGSVSAAARSAERPDAVRATGSFQGLDCLRAGDAVDGQARTGLVEGVLALPPCGEVFLGVMVEALGAERGEAREDLAAGIAVAALRGVVAMAEHTDAVRAAVGHAAQRLVLVGVLGDLQLDAEDAAELRDELDRGVVDGLVDAVVGLLIHLDADR